MGVFEEQLNKVKHQVIVDFGCGMGNFIDRILDAVNDDVKITGIDTSSRVVDMAKKKYENQEKVSIILSSAERTPFESETIDVVTISNSLHHILNQKEVFDEAHRILKKDGYLVINEMISDHLTPAQESHRLLHHFSAKIDRALNQFHQETYTRQTLDEILHQFTSFQVETTFEEEDLTEEPFVYVSEYQKIIDNQLKRISVEDPIFQPLEEEAHQIQLYIEQNGLHGATQILYFLRKI